jgi:hypothetical protein
MIVYQLGCEHHHTFEGWFRSQEDFDSQSARGLVECPVCGTAHVKRVPAGVNLAKSEMPAARESRRERALERAARQAREPRNGNAGSGDVQHEVVLSQQHSEMLTAIKSFLATHTENVGESFADVARRMHFGEEPHRSIRGKVTTQEAIALHEDGVPAWPVPPGIVFNEDSQ